MTERIGVGGVELAALRDSTVRGQLPRIFPDVPAPAWTPYRAWYPAAFDADTWVVPVRCFLLRDGARTILFDTGLGEGDFAKRWGVSRGELRDGLDSLGVTPDDVDIVVISHLHVDHVAGALRAVAPAFARARHILHRDWPAAVERLSPQGSAARAFLATATAHGLVDFVDDGHAVSDRVTLVHTPGHTPESASLLVGGAGERAFLIADAVHHVAHVTEPAWRDMNDADHARAVETRERILARAEADALVLAPAHFPEPFGRVVRVDGRRYWSAL